MFFIGEVAKMTQLSIDTLRYYEKMGLIDVERNQQNQRVYRQQELTWIEFIKRLKETGMSIANMQRYARLQHEGDRTIKERREMLEQQLVYSEKAIQQAEANCELLRKKITLYLQQEQRHQG